MANFRVSKNDSEDLGFAVTCLFTGSISRDEFNQWIYWVIANTDDELPTFFYYLDEFGPGLKDIYAVIGFSPSEDFSESETAALEAIGYRRKTLEPDSYAIKIGERSSPEKAARCLTRNPHIERRFEAAFPFLSKPIR